MKIAIPVENGRLSAHFGGSRQFAIVEIDADAKKVLRTDILPAPEHEPGAFPRWIQSLGVGMVIAGGIGQRALTLFAREGVLVLAGSPNEPIEKVVEAFLQGSLTGTPEGCTHHGEQHHHGHGHDCGR